VLDFEAEEFGEHHAEAGRLLAELWGLPSETALIAGRHHDPCEGMELDLLRIVHVACRLADVLGYDVVKPLAPSTAGDIIARLPARARARLIRDPQELCARIDQQIREFGSETTGGAPPEETLALLASAGAAGATGELEPAANIPESETETDSPEFSGEQTSPSRRQAIIGWMAVGLIIVVAVALWTFR